MPGLKWPSLPIIGLGGPDPARRIVARGYTVAGNLSWVGLRGGTAHHVMISYLLFIESRAPRMWTGDGQHMARAIEPLGGIRIVRYVVDGGKSHRIVRTINVARVSAGVLGGHSLQTRSIIVS